MCARGPPLLLAVSRSEESKCPQPWVYPDRSTLSRGSFAEGSIILAGPEARHTLLQMLMKKKRRKKTPRKTPENKFRSLSVRRLALPGVSVLVLRVCVGRRVR